MFKHIEDKARNLLPYEGIVHYYNLVLPKEKADWYYQALLNNIAWTHDRTIIFGKEIITKRKVAWYADKPFAYTYSKTTKIALPWQRELLALKAIVEQQSGETYNACLLNLYHNGSEGMAWHSDGEKELKKNAAISSLSFGAQRKFMFKHKKTQETISKVLAHGSLLVMKGTTQTHWLHQLPPTKKIHTPRINLTFRCVDKHDAQIG